MKHFNFQSDRLRPEEQRSVILFSPILSAFAKISLGSFLLILLSLGASLDGYGQCQNDTPHVLTYDFKERKFVKEVPSYIRMNKPVSVKVININANKYEVRGTILQYDLDFTDNDMQDIADKQAAPKEELSAADIEEDPSPDKSALTKKKDIINEFESSYNALMDSIESALAKANYDYRLVLNVLANSDSCLSIEKMKSISNYSSILAAKGASTTKLKDLKRMQSELTKLGVSDIFKGHSDACISSATNNLSLLDSALFLLDKLFLTVENNCTVYIPEFQVDGETVTIKIEHRQRSSTSAVNEYSTLTERKFGVARYLRLGFGTGPVMMRSPKNWIYNVVTETIREETEEEPAVEVQKIQKVDKADRLNISIAAFTDLEYQITPTTSFGLGAGIGINFAEQPFAMFLTGVNLGFRVRERAQVSFRTGLSFQKQEVLKSGLSTKVEYPSQQDLSELTTSKYRPGMFFGVTLNYLTKIAR
jgi:hypothetical protein